MSGGPSRPAWATLWSRVGGRSTRRGACCARCRAGRRGNRPSAAVDVWPRGRRAIVQATRGQRSDARKRRGADRRLSSRCRGTNRAGLPCRRLAVNVAGYCTVHDPETAQDMRELGRRGGRTPKITALRRPLPSRMTHCARRRARRSRRTRGRRREAQVRGS